MSKLLKTDFFYETKKSYGENSLNKDIEIKDQDDILKADVDNKSPNYQLGASDEMYSMNVDFTKSLSHNQPFIKGNKKLQQEPKESFTKKEFNSVEDSSSCSKSFSNQLVDSSFEKSNNYCQLLPIHKTKQSETIKEYPQLVGIKKERKASELLKETTKKNVLGFIIVENSLNHSLSKNQKQFYSSCNSPNLSNQAIPLNILKIALEKQLRMSLKKQKFVSGENGDNIQGPISSVFLQFQKRRRIIEESERLIFKYRQNRHERIGETSQSSLYIRKSRNLSLFNSPKITWNQDYCPREEEIIFKDRELLKKQYEEEYLKANESLKLSQLEQRKKDVEKNKNSEPKGTYSLDEGMKVLDKTEITKKAFLKKKTMSTPSLKINEKITYLKRCSSIDALGISNEKSKYFFKEIINTSFKCIKNQNKNFEIEKVLTALDKNNIQENGDYVGKNFPGIIKSNSSEKPSHENSVSEIDTNLLCLRGDSLECAHKFKSSRNDEKQRHEEKEFPSQTFLKQEISNVNPPCLNLGLFDHSKTALEQLAFFDNSLTGSPLFQNNYSSSFYSEKSSNIMSSFESETSEKQGIFTIEFEEFLGRSTLVEPNLSNSLPNSPISIAIQLENKRILEEILYPAESTHKNEENKFLGQTTLIEEGHKCTKNVEDQIVESSVETDIEICSNTESQPQIGFFEIQRESFNQKELNHEVPALEINLNLDKNIFNDFNKESFKEDGTKENHQEPIEFNLNGLHNFPCNNQPDQSQGEYFEEFPILSQENLQKNDFKEIFPLDGLVSERKRNEGYSDVMSRVNIQKISSDNIFEDEILNEPGQLRKGEEISQEKIEFNKEYTVNFVSIRQERKKATVYSFMESWKSDLHYPKQKNIILTPDDQNKPQIFSSILIKNEASQLIEDDFSLQDNKLITPTKKNIEKTNSENGLNISFPNDLNKDLQKNNSEIVPKDGAVELEGTFSNNSLNFVKKMKEISLNPESKPSQGNASATLSNLDLLFNTNKSPRNEIIQDKLNESKLNEFCSKRSKNEEEISQGAKQIQEETKQSRINSPSLAKQTSFQIDAPSLKKSFRERLGKAKNFFNNRSLSLFVSMEEDRKSGNIINFSKEGSNTQTPLNSANYKSPNLSKHLMSKNKHFFAEVISNSQPKNRDEFSNVSTVSSREFSSKLSFSDLSFSPSRFPLNEDLSFNEKFSLGESDGKTTMGIPYEDFFNNLASYAFDETLLLPSQNNSGCEEDIVSNIAMLYNENIGRVETFKKIGNEAACIKLLKELLQEILKQEKIIQESEDVTLENNKNACNFKFYKIQICNLLGFELFGLKKYDEALLYTDMAVALDRYNIQALYKQYQIYTKLQKDLEAKSILKRVRKLMQIQPISQSYKNFQLDKISIPSALSSSTNNSFYEGISKLPINQKFTTDLTTPVSKFRLYQFPQKIEEGFDLS